MNCCLRFVVMVVAICGGCGRCGEVLVVSPSDFLIFRMVWCGVGRGEVRRRKMI